jgi:Cof subfamily protein (haloacid dehalogenase superfamily)
MGAASPDFPGDGSLCPNLKEALFLSIRLVAVDLDDTLLDSSASVPSRVLDALTAARARGVFVTVATGRMRTSAAPYADLIGADAPFICYNGAMIVDPASGTVLAHHPIHLGVAREVLSLFRIMGWYIQSYLNDKLLVRTLEDPRARAYAELARVPAIPLGDDLYFPSEAPTKLLAIAGEKDDLEDMARCTRACFGRRLYAARSKARYLDIAAPEVNKGMGLAEVARILGVPMNEVLAVGDSDNDAEMIAAAGVGVAMGNGSEKARTAADWIAPGNDEAGVAAALEKYVLI